MLKNLVAASALLLAGCSVQNSSYQEDNSQGVVGGKLLAKVGEFPASRSLVIIEQTRDGKAAGFCTGVLIDKNIVLTAAHCLETHPASNGFRIIFALSQRASADRIRVGAKFVQHPAFRENPTEQHTFDFGSGKTKVYTMDKHNDIAIVSFYGDIPADARAAQLPPAGLDLSYQPIYIYGAGHSQYITGEQFRDPKYYYYSHSFGNLRRGKALINANYNQYPDFYFTAPTSEAHTCKGDSGGPQFLASAEFPTVVGINSAMLVNDLDGQNKDSVCGNTALASKVSAFLPWIETQKALLKSELN